MSLTHRQGSSFLHLPPHPQLQALSDRTVGAEDAELQDWVGIEESTAWQHLGALVMSLCLQR